LVGSIALTPTTSQTRSRNERIQAVAKEIRPVSENSDRLTMVIYGRNGTGKTTFACSSGLKTLVIDCNEKGTQSVRKLTNVDKFVLGNFERLDWVYWYLRAGNHPYQVVVIDTVTMLAMMCMKYILKDDADRDIGRDPMMPDKRHWGKLGEMIKDAIIKFRNLSEHPTHPVHVIFTAQEKTTYNEDDEDGETKVETHPELSPSPRSTLLSAVAIIGRLYTREVELPNGRKEQERRMLLGTHPKYVSKNRYEELRRIERKPTLKVFIDRIAGETDATSQGDDAR
jgi:phage nucleotide-binding protein